MSPPVTAVLKGNGLGGVGWFDVLCRMICDQLLCFSPAERVEFKVVVPSAKIPRFFYSPLCRKPSLRPPIAFIFAEVKGVMVDAHVLPGKSPPVVILSQAVSN